MSTGTRPVLGVPRVAVAAVAGAKSAAFPVIKPVGAVDWFKEQPYGKWPWTKDKWGSDLPEIVGERDDYSMEKIAG